MTPITIVNRLDSACADWQSFPGGTPEEVINWGNHCYADAREKARRILDVLKADGPAVIALAEEQGIDAGDIASFLLATGIRSEEACHAARVILARLRARLNANGHFEAKTEAGGGKQPGQTDARPPMPTAAYCMLPGFQVRWKGDPIELRRQLWNLLNYLLGRTSYPIPTRDVQHAIWQKEPPSPQHFSNTLSALNKELMPIQFPWEWSVKEPYVMRNG